MFRECAAYKISIPPAILSHYLPHQQPAYRENTRKNFARRMFFFSKLLAPFTRTPLDDYIDQLDFAVSFPSFLRQVSRERGSTIRYNCVVLNDYAIFIRVPTLRNDSYRMLCKHITISGRAKFARFAGEIWSAGHDHFVVNNNSGTYRPPDQLIDPTIELFKHLAPRSFFQGESYRFR